MKLFFYIFTAILTIMLFIPENQAQGTIASEKELEEIHTIIKENDFQLKEWQIVVRQNITINNMKSYIKGLTGFDFGKTQIDNLTKYSADRQSSNGIIESILLVEKESSDREYQVVYRISSTLFTKEVQKDYAQKLRAITNDLFTENAQYFTCLEAEKSGMIDIVALIEKISDRLNLSIYNELEDRNFTSWSGYTPEWEQTIPVGNHKINTQIVVRDLPENQSALIIGTPILISEY